MTERDGRKEARTGLLLADFGSKVLKAVQSRCAAFLDEADIDAAAAKARQVIGCLEAREYEGDPEFKELVALAVLQDDD